MNYLAHGLPWLDDAYVLAGAAVPDWLCVVDRRTRIRSRQALPFVDASDGVLAGVARGIVEHHADDRWFHETRAFAELSLDFCRRLRQVLPADDAFRPYFLGHISVELLLDSELTQAQPSLLQRYYRQLEALDAEHLAWAISQIAGKPIADLARFIELFLAERFLWDYLHDATLLMRLNQVMRRVGLPVLPAFLQDQFPAMRQAVSDNAAALLSGRDPVLSTSAIR